MRPIINETNPSENKKITKTVHPSINPEKNLITNSSTFSKQVALC